MHDVSAPTHQTVTSPADSEFTARTTDPEPSRYASPAKACVLGAPLNVGNRGVLALGVSLAWLLTRLSPGVDLFFHYGGVSGGRRRLAGSAGEDGSVVTVRNCRMSPRSRPGEHILVILVLAALYRLGFRRPAIRNAWLRALLEADLVADIRGGDSFSDIYGFRRFLVGSLPLLSVALMGRPFVMLPQTYGPFSWRVSRALARFMLRRAAQLLTRDRNCESIVFELCGRVPSFCPDVAFTLEPVKPARLLIAPRDLDLNASELIVSVNVSGLLYMGGYTRQNMFGLCSHYPDLMEELLRGILDSTQAKILLVPHVFGEEEEEQACASLLRSYESTYSGRLFSVACPLSERELKWVIGKTHFFIGSRMHACIAALSQFVPTIGLSYSDKFHGVFDSAGVRDCVIDLRTASTSAVLRRALSALESRDVTRARLESHIPTVQEAVRDTFRDLLRPAQGFWPRSSGSTV